MGLRLKQLQGTCKGVRDDRDLRDHQVGTGEAMNPESVLNPSSSRQDQCPGSLLTCGAGIGAQEAGCALGSGARQSGPSQVPLRPLGLSSGKWLAGLQRIPAAERVAAQPPALPNSSPAARLCGSPGWREQGAPLWPRPEPQRKGDRPASGRGRSRSSPSPPAALG